MLKDQGSHLLDPAMFVSCHTGMSDVTCVRLAVVPVQEHPFPHGKYHSGPSLFLVLLITKHHYPHLFHSYLLDQNDGGINVHIAQYCIVY